uniref:transposase n=1 Tax=Dyadobacter tibetensis TaxID=1211851 RepID=UPI0010391EE8
MDAVIFKVRQEGKIINKAVQIAVGLNDQGKKRSTGYVDLPERECILLDECADKSKKPGC